MKLDFNLNCKSNPFIVSGKKNYIFSIEQLVSYYIDERTLSHCDGRKGNCKNYWREWYIVNCLIQLEN